jgi:hypothetical protein
MLKGWERMVLVATTLLVMGLCVIGAWTIAGVIIGLVQGPR